MSTAWSITKCIAALFASLTLGFLVSLCGMLVVVFVNAWDDAPGGGIFILMALAVGTIAGVLSGAMCSMSIWKHRREIDKSKVLTTTKGLLAIVVGVSLWPAVLILPWTGPHRGFRVALSSSAACALAAWALLLIYQGAKALALFDPVTNTHVP
jgi:uncharacterized membrane-anchored protein